MTALCPCNTATSWLAGLGTRSAGDDGVALARRTVEAAKEAKAGVVAGSNFVFHDLYALAEERGTTLHDCKVLALAQKFLLALASQEGLTEPELALDSDGDVVFDWTGSGGRMLTVALREDGRVSYAARITPLDRENGTKQFADAVDPQLLRLVQQVTAP